MVLDNILHTIDDDYLVWKGYVEDNFFFKLKNIKIKWQTQFQLCETEAFFYLFLTTFFHYIIDDVVCYYWQYKEYLSFRTINYVNRVDTCERVQNGKVFIIASIIQHWKIALDCGVFDLYRSHCRKQMPVNRILSLRSGSRENIFLNNPFFLLSINFNFGGGIFSYLQWCRLQRSFLYFLRFYNGVFILRSETLVLKLLEKAS